MAVMLIASACAGGDVDDETDAPSGVPAEQALPETANYKTVTAGGGHSCAITTDDTITCWGPLPPPVGVRWIAPGG